MADEEMKAAVAKPEKKLIRALLRDGVDALGLSNTYEALRGEFREIGRAWKTLLLLALFLVVLAWHFTADHLSGAHAEEERALAADYNRKIAGRDKEVNTLRFDLQTVRSERDKAQLELAGCRT